MVHRAMCKMGCRVGRCAEQDGMQVVAWAEQDGAGRCAEQDSVRLAKQIGKQGQVSRIASRKVRRATVSAEQAVQDGM